MSDGLPPAVDSQSQRTPIEDGARVAMFLADPAVVAAFKRLEEGYFGEFRRAKADDLRAIHAKVAALGDIRTELVTIVNNGVVAKHAQQKQEKYEQARKQRGPR